MQSVEMICVSLWSITGCSTDVCHKDGSELEFGFCDECGLTQFEKEKRIYAWIYMDVFQ